MDKNNETERLAASQVHAALSRAGDSRHGITGDSVRWAAHRAAAAARRLGGGVEHLASGAVDGTMRAAVEIGSETTGFVRDAVIGVVEGSEQVIRVGAPAIGEAVLGALRGTTVASTEVVAASQDAVEGAIVAASSLGMDISEAAAAAVDGAAEAVVQSGADLRDAVSPVISGVISAVRATGNDLEAAVRAAATRLTGRAARADPTGVRAAAVAGEVVATVVEKAPQSSGTEEEFGRVVTAAGLGAVAAAEMVSRIHANRVRGELLRRIAAPRPDLSPAHQGQLAAVSQRLAGDFSRAHAAWRWSAVAMSFRILVRCGASDQAASLAYFSVLSFFPLVALVIIGFSFIGDPATILPVLEDLVVYYLPASSDVVGAAMAGLLEHATALGFLAFAGLLISANGLFMAATRAVNRVFAVEKHKSFTENIAEALVNAALGLALLVSVGMSAFVQIALGLGAEAVALEGEASRGLQLALGVVAAILPAAVTGVVFIVVYHNLPNMEVEWRDAAFGGVIALLLFEAGKHLFFWLSGMAAGRFIVYGPVASSIVMLTWAYVAALVFLLGAALARASGELRPKPLP